MTARAALTLGLLLTLGGRLGAQSPVGVASIQPPQEDAYVYKQVPDVQILRTGADATRLSALWQDKPMLLGFQSVAKRYYDPPDSQIVQEGNVGVQQRTQGSPL